MHQTTSSMIPLKWLAVLLMGLSLSLSLQAQSVPIPENMTSVSVLRRDTAKAVHHLFRARRIGGIVNIGIGLYGIYGGVQMVNSIASTNSVLNGTYFSDPASRSSSFPTSILSTLPGDLIVGMGISKWIRFKKKKEIALLAAYERGVPLPTEIQRRLNSKHLVPSTLAKPTVIPDTLINRSAVIASTLISTTGVVTDTLLSAPINMPAPMTVASVLHGDTVRAIHHLFSARRGGSTGNIILGVILAGGGIALAAAIRGASNAFAPVGAAIGSLGRSSSYTPATSPSGLSIGWPGILITGVGIAKSARFGKDREQLIIEAYENGIPLPMTIKRKLEAKLFN